ncbi:MAG: hypothetical protein AAF447_16315 [Myxococcota bacterium]
MAEDGNDPRGIRTLDDPDASGPPGATGAGPARHSGVLPTQADPRGDAPEGESDPVAEVLPTLDARAVHRLRVRGTVGSGGMGLVRRVYDRALRRTTAMKTIHAERWKSLATRRLFLREARVMAQLDHPNVVPVHELGLGPDGRLFFTYILHLLLFQMLNRHFQLLPLLTSWQ